MKNDLRVHAGTNFLNISGAVYDVANFTRHENYDDYSYANDIAIVHLKTPITYNTLVKPVRLAVSDKQFEGKPCILSGWGTTRVISKS